MTSALLTEVYRQIYRLNSDALRDGVDTYLERKGEIQGLKWLLGKLETMESEILGNTGQADEEEGTE